MCRNHGDVWNRCAADRQDERKRMNAFCSGDKKGRNGAIVQEEFWYISKECLFSDFIKLSLHSYGECKTPLNGHHAWDFTLWIPFFSFIPIPPFSFFSPFFSITALADFQHLSFFIGLLTLQTALQHSWAWTMPPPPHLCVHTTPCPSKTLWYPSQRPPRNILALVLLHSCSVFDHNPTDCSLTLLLWLYFSICSV